MISFFYFKVDYFSGEGNLIEEQSEIINRIETEGETGTVPVMIIGNSNVFEVNKTIMTEAMFLLLEISNENIYQSRASTPILICPFEIFYITIALPGQLAKAKDILSVNF